MGDHSINVHDDLDTVIVVPANTTNTSSISVGKSNLKVKSESNENVSGESLSKSKNAEEKVEMVYKKTEMDKLSELDLPLLHGDALDTNETTNSMQSAASGRMNKLRDHSSNIFPAGIMGCKTDNSASLSPRRFIDAKEASKHRIGHIQNTPRKRPSSAKYDSARNCVTGTGVNATDELKSSSSRRKDGNPLLGEGYEKKISSSSTRIPPGGFSQGLW